MTSGEIRNWLAIAAVIAAGAWSYFQLNSDVQQLSDTVNRLERELPTSVSTAREAAVSAITGAENTALEQLDSEKVRALDDIADAKVKTLANLTASFSSEGKLTLGGVCFEPKQLIRCFGDQGRNDADHITWVGNRAERECVNQTPPRNVERRILILAECGKEN